MKTRAIVLEAPTQLALRTVELSPPGPDDVVVDVDWSGISTGTEKLLWSGRMPPFPGMGYPLVPGYESVGRISAAGEAAARRVGERVFVPGSHGFTGVRCLFGGAAAQLVVPAARAVPIAESLAEDGILLALAATAHHALAAQGSSLPELIIGHGVLGRLLARLTLALGGRAPKVWEREAARRTREPAYEVIASEDDPRRDYRSIYDVSGDPQILDAAIARLARGGEIVLAGYYATLSFEFAPAFMREARLRVAAEWRPEDLARVIELLERGALSLAGLVTHREPALNAASAYERAFRDPGCIKMILDWRTQQ